MRLGYSKGLLVWSLFMCFVAWDIPARAADGDSVTATILPDDALPGPFDTEVELDVQPGSQYATNFSSQSDFIRFKNVSSLKMVDFHIFTDRSVELQIISMGGTLAFPGKDCGIASLCSVFATTTPGIAPGSTLNFQLSVISTDRIAVRIVPTFVPEPTAWSLFIAGFGLIGAKLRQRRIPARAQICEI